MKKLLIACILLSTIISSCSIQRRHYNKGYHIAWNKSLQKKVEKPQSEFNVEVNEPENEVLASISTSPEIIISDRKFSLKDSCDIILFKNNKQFYVTILEVGENTIKYKMCNAKNDSVITVASSSVSMIKHTNGWVERIIEKPAPTTNYVPIVNSDPVDPSKLVTHPLADFSFILAIISIPLVFVYGVGILVGLLAMIFGFVAKNKIEREPHKYKGSRKAKFAIAIGIIYLGAILIVSIIAIVFLAPFIF